MFIDKKYRLIQTLAAAITLAVPLSLFPQSPTPVHKRALVTKAIDATSLHTLAGNTRSAANPANDAGAVSSDLALDHMTLQLRRAPEMEQAFNTYVDQLHDKTSPNYHKWLSPSDIGKLYGPAQSDLDAVTSWLTSNGFTVNFVAPSGMTIDFSGTAGQVNKAFHTSIHHLNVKGQAHIANMSDPQIPDALAPVVAGVVSLHDFKPHAMKQRHANYTFQAGQYPNFALVPGDLATIYNLNPLFSAGLTGKGQTIAVIEDTDLYSTQDWNTFRTTFGLDQYTSGNLTVVHPAPASGTNNCVVPGVVSGGADGEAILDAEWSSAAAPDASIQVAACADTRVTFGGLIALQNIVNGSNPPSVVSISYGECEAEDGASANAAFNSVYQQAVAEGISVFVSAGDEGAASCDAGQTGATHGVGVSAWASTPYNVAVGGTDFGDAYSGTTSTYWNKTNSATYDSALTYVPEIPWNDSCAGSLLANYSGFSTVYGTSGFCGSSAAKDYLNVVAGSGGPSGCATGNPQQSGVVGGTCQGYAKPSWQTGAGVPSDGVRDIPDVSLFSGDGVWGHYYVTCWSNRRAGGAACTGDPSNWAGAGGTSFSSPIMAGIQAIINQKTGDRQGNPNYRYYQLSAQSNATCNAASGDASGCIFHNVTQGDIVVNCGGTVGCFGASTDTTLLGGQGGRGGSGGGGGGHHGLGQANANGALSLSGDSYTPAFSSASGWNFATGLGSINAYNLVNNW